MNEEQPNKRRQTLWLEVTINVLFWILTTWLAMNLFTIDRQEIEIVDGKETVMTYHHQNLYRSVGITVLVSCIMFYTSLTVLLRFVWRSTWIKPLASLLIIILVSLLTNEGMHILLFESGELRMPVSFAVLVLVFYGGVSLAYGLSKLWWRSEVRRQQLEVEKHKTELALLKQQLHPHFLFNVLNNMLAGIDQQAHPALVDTIDRLSGLLRYVVYDIQRETVPLSKELNFCKDLISLYEERYEQGELNFMLEIKGDHLDQPIQPGLLIPFFENAVKHGMEPEKVSSIEATLDVSNPHRFHFKMKNPIPSTHLEREGPGMGLNNLTDRLVLSYPDRHVLHISEENDSFNIELSITTYESDYH